MKGFMIDAGALLGGGQPDPERVAAMAEERRESTEDVAITARRLLDAYAEVTNPHKFKPGDLVLSRRYSPYTLPTKERPGIIVRVLDKPVLSACESSDSWDWRNELDVVVGVFNRGSFVTFHQSSLYLEPYTGPVEP